MYVVRLESCYTWITTDIVILEKPTSFKSLCVKERKKNTEPKNILRQNHIGANH